jgi:hypothetical protein
MQNVCNGSHKSVLGIIDMFPQSPYSGQLKALPVLPDHLSESIPTDISRELTAEFSISIEDGSIEVPEVVVQQIFQLLGKRELSSAILVSRQWRVISYEIAKMKIYDLINVFNKVLRFCDKDELILPDPTNDSIREVSRQMSKLKGLNKIMLAMISAHRYTQNLQEMRISYMAMRVEILKQVEDVELKVKEYAKMKVLSANQADPTHLGYIFQTSAKITELASLKEQARVIPFWGDLFHLAESTFDEYGSRNFPRLCQAHMDIGEVRTALKVASDHRVPGVLRDYKTRVSKLFEQGDIEKAIKMVLQMPGKEELEHILTRRVMRFSMNDQMVEAIRVASHITEIKSKEAICNFLLSELSRSFNLEEIKELIAKMPEDMQKLILGGAI